MIWLWKIFLIKKKRFLATGGQIISKNFIDWELKFYVLLDISCVI